jgi:RNA polymerase sigma-B factor
MSTPYAPRRAAELAEERALFARYRRCRDPALRESLVERSLPLARHLAARYDAPGHADDDVVQVASLALVKAVDRFEPDRGVAFSTYAVPTIVGEIKRYFRDQTWDVHVSRDLRERAMRAMRDDAESPDIDARRAAIAYRAASLDAPQRGCDGADVTLGETIGYDDERLATAEQRADLSGLVACLSPRERAVLRLRFEHDLTQAEIAGLLGVSQLHVSRILRRALERLRKLDERPPRA